MRATSNLGLFQPGRNESAFNIVRLLKACGTQKDLDKGSKLHAYIREHKYLEANLYVASTLINMYAKCGALSKAEEVLKELPLLSVVPWNALIAGFVQQGQGEEALKCFERMKHQGHNPNAVTFTCVLQACGSIGAAVKGQEIHDTILGLGMLQKNIVLGSSLVDMYVKCGALSRAAQVLEELPVRDVVTWSTLIAGYAGHGRGLQALKIYDNMQCEGNSPDVVTFACALKACGSIGATAKGEQIHDKIGSMGMLNKDVVLGSALVDMYAKCGELSKAQRVLEELPVHDVVLWNTLIAGYVQQGQGEEALQCYDSMQCEGHRPDMFTFTHVLKACASIRIAVKGEEIHKNIVRLGILEKNILLENALIDMYIKCGAVAKAQQLLEGISIRDVVTWSVLIGGYAQQGQSEEALKCYDRMQHEGCTPNAITFTCALKACGSLGTAGKGRQIHEKIVSLGMLEQDIFVGSTLVDMYAKGGALTKAQEVFKKLPVLHVCIWNALIAGYAQQNQGEKALKYFDTMQCEGYSPNAVTFICALKACGSIAAVAKGKLIHDDIINLGMLEKNLVLGNALVDMYANCGALTRAQQVLEDLLVRDVVTWSALMSGYALQGQGKEALECYASMQQEGHFPDVVTFACALKACGTIGALAEGEKIHREIANPGILESSLVDMYAKCGALAKACCVLNELPVQDVATWNALMMGYAQQGQQEEVLKCYECMQQDGHFPNAVSFMCALRACGSLGAIAKDEQTHGELVNCTRLRRIFKFRDALMERYASVVHLPGLTMLEQISKWLVHQGTSLENGIYFELNKFSLHSALHAFDYIRLEHFKSYHILLQYC